MKLIQYDIDSCWFRSNCRFARSHSCMTSCSFQNTVPRCALGWACMRNLCPRYSCSTWRLLLELLMPGVSTLPTASLLFKLFWPHNFPITDAYYANLVPKHYRRLPPQTFLYALSLDFSFLFWVKIKVKQ